jgi:hypothetical protein
MSKALVLLPGVLDQQFMNAEEMAGATGLEPVASGVTGRLAILHHQRLC